MQILLEPEQEARLSELASREGRPANEIVREVIAHYLEVDLDFVRAVEQGIASADRGDVIDHDEAVRRIERHFSA
jgi:predicted transcriptional regulator